MTPPIAIDLFCGVGGMSLGFEQAGFKVIGAFDWEQRNVDTYNINFKNHKAYKVDLSNATGEVIRNSIGRSHDEIDVIFGGPPCQGFSIGGAQDPEDERNKLIGSFAKLVHQLRPKYFIMENVQGLVSERSESVARAFVTRIRKSGYDVVEPIKVLNAADFGVPQRRRRVFFLGYRKDLPIPEYPTAKHTQPTVWDAIGDLPDIDEFDYLLESDDYLGQLGKASPYAQILRGDCQDPTDLSQRVITKQNKLTGCSRSIHTALTIKRFQNTQPGSWETVSRYFRLHPTGIAATMRAGTDVDHGKHTAPRPIHPKRPRCITTREAARLHSYPDWFVFHPTKWHSFRQIGNSVPPRLSKSVASQLYNLITTSKFSLAV